MSKTKKQPAQAENQWLTAMCRVLKGTGVGFVVVLAGLMLSAALISLGVLREGTLDGVVPACCVLGGLCGGLFALLEKTLERPLLMGVGTGAALFLVLLCVGVVLNDGTGAAQQGAGILCACCCGGGMAGIFRRKPKKKRRR